MPVLLSTMPFIPLWATQQSLDPHLRCEFSRKTRSVSSSQPVMTESPLAWTQTEAFCSPHPAQTKSRFYIYVLLSPLGPSPPTHYYERSKCSLPYPSKPQSSITSPPTNRCLLPFLSSKEAWKAGVIYSNSDKLGLCQHSIMCFPGWAPLWDSVSLSTAGTLMEELRALCGLNPADTFLHA